MSKINAEVQDVENTGEGANATVALPPIPAAPESIPAWRDTGAGDPPSEELVPGAIPAHTDSKPSERRR